MTRQRRKPGAVGAAGPSEFIHAEGLDNAEDNTDPRKTKTSFARAAAAEAFGHYRYFGWRQWGRFRDRSPAEIARLRGTP